MAMGTCQVSGEKPQISDYTIFYNAYNFYKKNVALSLLWANHMYTKVCTKRCSKNECTLKRELKRTLFTEEQKEN